jgi:hypothetical protein
MDFKEEGGTADEPMPVAAWKRLLHDELARSSVRQRLAIGIAGIAWIHLGCFIALQLCHDPSIRTDLRHPALWLAELVAVLYYLRKSLGKGWIRSSSAINLVAKFWTTFLILSFNLVTLNAITGFDLAWYKPAWATLSTFYFASLAWLFTPLFFIPAVQMWATGLLMVNFPEWCFLIYGVSWWIALTGIAAWIRPRALAPQG